MTTTTKVRQFMIGVGGTRVAFHWTSETDCNCLETWSNTFKVSVREARIRIRRSVTVNTARKRGGDPSLQILFGKVKFNPTCVNHFLVRPAIEGIISSVSALIRAGVAHNLAEGLNHTRD